MNTTIISVIIVNNNNTNILKTIQSLTSQIDPAWLGLIVTTDKITDEIQSELNKDNRFKIIDCTGEKNKTIEFYKNYGASFAYTDWITFIDGGDTILNSFILNIRQKILSNPSLDCIFFKVNKNNIIYPLNGIIAQSPLYNTYFCYKTLLFYYDFQLNEGKSLVNLLLSRKYILLPNILYNAN